MTKTVNSIVLAAALLAAAPAVRAAEPQGWQFEVTPYAWAAGIEGDATVGAHHIDFKKSFSDLTQYVDLAGSALGVVQYDRYLVWTQWDYFHMSTNNITDSAGAGGNVDEKMTMGVLAVGYKVNGWMEGQYFDLLVGARMLNSKFTLNTNHSGSFEKSNTITDAVVLMRPSIRVLPSKINGLRFNPTISVGAGDSKLCYEMQPQFQYDISEHVATRFGYRRVGYEFSKSNSTNEVNLTFAGLLVGLGVKW